MIIRTIRIQNFRSLRDETLPCNNLTILIGPNGAGKSSFLRAIDMFYTPFAKYTEDDFYNRDIENPIVFRVTFSDLNDEERDLYSPYIDGDRLTVEKVLTWPPSRASQKYYGASLQNPAFAACRAAATAADLKAAYNALRAGSYNTLPSYTNRERAEQALKEWEQANPSQCERLRDDGQFFGFKEVGTARLDRYTRYIRIPAVRDAAADAAEGKGAVLTDLLDLVVRSVLLQKEEIIELQKETLQKYKEIVDPTELAELHKLESDLTSTLKTYVPSAGVLLSWKQQDSFELPLPKADIRLVEDEYATSVERTGHGLQRAFILTMLQHLAVTESRQSENARTAFRSPNLILGIEEPELYQHPNRQRHFFKILVKLATGTIRGVSDQTQVIYTTHAPLFVDVNSYDKVRCLRKLPVAEKAPKCTYAVRTTTDDIAREIALADGKSPDDYKGISTPPRLRSIMTPMINEGFFADLAVLVEGESDKAVILGAALAEGYDLEANGVSVIPCNGKNNLDRPIVIFRQLGIPVYAIWDSDRDKAKEDSRKANHRLLRLFGREADDWPNRVEREFACFENNLEFTLRSELGANFYDKMTSSVCELLCYRSTTEGLKNPQVIEEVLVSAKGEGRQSRTLTAIIAGIIALREATGILPTLEQRSGQE